MVPEMWLLHGYSNMAAMLLLNIDVIWLPQHGSHVTFVAPIWHSFLNTGTTWFVHHCSNVVSVALIRYDLISMAPTSFLCHCNKASKILRILQLRFYFFWYTILGGYIVWGQYYFRTSVRSSKLLLPSDFLSFLVLYSVEEPSGPLEWRNVLIRYI